MVREAITTHRIDGSRRVTWVSNAEAPGRIIRRSGELPQSEGEELPIAWCPISTPRQRGCARRLNSIGSKRSRRVWLETEGFASVRLVWHAANLSHNYPGCATRV
jgi:hypothetical protein